MTTKLGRIVANTRPGNIEIYLDGKPVLDSSGKIAKTPTIILNVTEGVHNVTFSKPGYDITTVMVTVREGADTDARAILTTKFMRYPMMLSPTEQSKQSSNPLIESSQPAPGWPSIPVPQIPYGHMVANTVPDGAQIYLDGQPVLDINGNIAITPASVIGIVTGIHRVTFRKEGYFDESIEVNIENGLYSDAYVALRPHMANLESLPLESLPYPYGYPGTGDVEINSTPQGAYIYVDNNSLIDDMGHAILTPTRVSGVPEGIHQIQISLDGYYSKKIFLNVIPNKVNNVSTTLQSVIENE